jgi:hypothetical protein
VLFPEERFPFEREDLAPQAEWWLEVGDSRPVEAQPVTCRFPDSGLASIAGPRSQILVDSGPFGFGGAGHSHADCLSVTVRSGARDLLIDPGTYTYISDPELRNRFRGTGFHNTIRIDGLDQADPAGPFRWENKPRVSLNQWLTEGNTAYLDASCAYRDFTHRRRVFCVIDEWLFVLDEVTGPEGLHQVEQFWHLGDREVPLLLSEPAAAVWQGGLRSRVLGQKEHSPMICASWHTTLPLICGAALALGAQDVAALSLKRNGMTLRVPGVVSVEFTSPGMPVWRREA